VTKKISIERHYWLGDFKHIKIIEETAEIPNELSNNEEFIEAVTLLTLLHIEKTYNKYLKVLNSTKGLSIEDALLYLEDLTVREVDTLEKILKEAKA